MPYHPRTAEVVILRHRDRKVLASRTVSPHPPTVRLLFPNGGELLSGDKPVTVRWTAADADEDRLSYFVLFSRDGGASWEALDLDLSEARLELGPAELPGTDRAIIRVVATDGVNTASDDSDAPFRVEKKSSQVVIFNPRSKANVEAGTAVLLRGTALDAEDGTLPDKSLTWTSDRDGRLGVGSYWVTKLSLGLHTITLAASDSDGNTSTAQIQLEVTQPSR